LENKPGRWYSSIIKAEILTQKWVYVPEEKATEEHPKSYYLPIKKKVEILVNNRVTILPDMGRDPREPNP